jgi:hypothetical protein
MTRWIAAGCVVAAVLVANTMVAIYGISSSTASASGGLDNCATSSYPTHWPNGANDSIVWGQNWDVTSMPSTWYPFSGFYPGHSLTYQSGDTTDRLQSQLTYPGTYIQLNNAVGGTSPSYINDAGIGTLASLNSGPSKGTVFYAWCARFNDSKKFDTVAEVQESGTTWPPEVAFVASPGKNGIVSNVSVHVYWLTANGYYANGVTCNGDCNVHGLATWSSPANAWNEFAVGWSTSEIRVYELVGSHFVLEATITDAVCGTLSDGPGYTEPCVPNGNSFQWTFQQNSLDGITTVNNGTSPSGLAWVANYSDPPVRRGGDAP